MGAQLVKGCRARAEYVLRFVSASCHDQVYDAARHVHRLTDEKLARQSADPIRH